MKSGISVVVCTYNGALLLPETLRHIALQHVQPEINWEVIVIDNASSDYSSKVAVTAWEKFGNPVQFTLLNQPKQGLSYARELALAKAQYEFVLFCDDDNWLNPNYVTHAFNLMSNNSSIGVLGGCGELVFETPPPRWAQGHSVFANGPQAKASGKVKNNILYGAGFILRKSAFKTLSAAGFKPMLSDRRATSLSAGGDYELCCAIALAGYEIWYSEELKFKHFMPAKRICWNNFLRLVQEGAKSFEVLIPYRIRVNLGSRNILSFNLFYFGILLSYIGKFVPVYLKKYNLTAGPEEAKLNMIKLISLKSKIRSFKEYRTMKKNFLKIVHFEQEKLRTFLAKNDALKHRSSNLNKA